MKPGVPDLCIPVAKKGFHGLYIEMKKERGGSLTQHQINWLDLLNAEGYKAVCCHGSEKAIQVIEDYFG